MTMVMGGRKVLKKSRCCGFDAKVTEASGAGESDFEIGVTVCLALGFEKPICKYNWLAS
jgi:hypothetical protein